MEVILLVPHNPVPLPEQHLDIFLHLVHVQSILHLHADGLHIGNAQHALLSRGQGNNHHIILVLPHRGLPLALQQADYPEGLVIDTDIPAHGIFTAKEVLCHGSADNSHPVTLIHVVRADEGAGLHHQRLDIHVLRGYSLHAGVPVLIAVDNLVAAADAGRNKIDIPDFGLYGPGILILQCLHGACRSPGAAPVG